MRYTQIRCPTCSKKGTIEILPESLDYSLSGIVTINIAKDIICSHSFIAYIDKNLNARDYFIPDFQIEIPQITNDELSKASKIPRKDLVDIDLIKLNIPATLLTYILRSIFLKQKVVIIQNQVFLHKHIYNFFKYITQNSFETNIIILTEEIYKNNKKNYKDSMIFNNFSVLRNVKNLINPKKLSIEKHFVSRFVSEGNLSIDYIVLKNDILKAFEFSKKIVDLINDCKENNKTVNSLKIKTQLEKLFNIKINMLYFKFLIGIVETYFKVSLPSISSSFIET